MKLSELRRRVEEGTEYDLLVAAGIIRSLLLDAVPLMDVVNRTHRKRLTFKFASIRDDPLDPNVPVEIFESIQDGIDPETSRAPDRAAITGRDGFLGADVIRLRRKVYEGSSLVWHCQRWTVKDVVLAAAQAEGGIHYDPNPHAVAGALRSFSAALQIGGQSVSIRSIAGIGRVVLRALEPIGSLPDARQG